MKNGDSYLVSPLRIDMIYASYINNQKIIVDVYERNSKKENFDFITREFANKTAYKHVPILPPEFYEVNYFWPDEDVYQEIKKFDLETNFTNEELTEFELLKEEYRIDTETDAKSQYANFLPIICLLGLAMLVM